MDGGALERVRARLERDSWRWAELQKIGTRHECEPFVRGIMDREGCAQSDAVAEQLTAYFCELIIERKKALIEMERVERVRQAWLHAAAREN